MNIYIAADHNGYQMKNELVEWLQNQKHEVTDFGADEFDKGDDYPDFGIKVAKAVAEDPDNRYGIVLCGSGVGMAVVADKVPGIRAALIHDPAIAEAGQRDDNINVLALGADYINIERAQEVITSWLNTPFSGEERHERRIQKITDYEHSNLCPPTHEK